MKRYIRSAEESYILYRNKRDKNKYIEVRKLTDGHTEYRSFMFWNTDRGSVKNYYTSKSNKGRWHRGSQESVRKILEDYIPVESVEDGVKDDYSYRGAPKNPNDAVVASAKNWPEELTYDDYEEGDQIIEVFIDVVGDLNLFEETSARGGVGEDFFYNDATGELLAEIDINEEMEQLEDLYYSSNSKNDFKNKVRNWMIDLCGLEGTYQKY